MEESYTRASRRGRARTGEGRRGQATWRWKERLRKVPHRQRPPTFVPKLPRSGRARVKQQIKGTPPNRRRQFTSSSSASLVPLLSPLSQPPKTSPPCPPPPQTHREKMLRAWTSPVPAVVRSAKTHPHCPNYLTLFLCKTFFLKYPALTR
jgi:hypothetical protein